MNCVYGDVQEEEEEEEEEETGRKMTISNSKLAKSHTRSPGHGYEKETLKKKLNLF